VTAGAHLVAEILDKQIGIFDDSRHWPFADNPQRTNDLLVPFVRGAIARDAA
jgi:pimeloyl-ACP methyl ester carboxylesterase